MTPLLTIAVCTYNRAALLPRALDSLVKQTGSTQDLEVLVVDNGSTDETEALVARRQGDDPSLRYVVEPIAGIAHARNRAMQEARGEYLAFLDDDAWANQDWIEHLLGVLNSVRPVPQCVVGPVTLVWEGRRPEWFPERFESLLCSYNMGDAAHFLGADGYLLTTNSLFHRPTLLALGGMRTDLGHRRKSLLGGEDNDIFNRLLANGNRIYYEPKALVYHPVPKERQTRRFLLRRLFWDGASQPLVETSANQQSVSRPWSEVYRSGKRACRFLLETLCGVVSGNRVAAAGGVYQLVQRLGRLRTNVLMALGTMKDADV
jgi:glycosyltransferase involved in cell wall biosynthesis